MHFSENFLGDDTQKDPEFPQASIREPETEENSAPPMKVEEDFLGKRQ